MIITILDASDGQNFHWASWDKHKFIFTSLTGWFLSSVGTNPDVDGNEDDVDGNEDDEVFSLVWKK